MSADSPEVLSFRVGEMEKNLSALRSDLKEAVGSLGGGMTALQTQLASYQANLGDRFVTRRDWEQHNREVAEKFRQLAAEQDTGSTRLWIAVSALAALGSFCAALVGWFRPLH